ncbi:MAG: SusC/RagA family TonB-linked outer membrane protein, partial [Paludibacter sp.]
MSNILNLDIIVNQQLDFLTKGLSFRIKGSYNSQYSHTKDRSSSKALYLANYLHDLDPSAPDDKTIVYKKIGTDGILGYNESFVAARNWYFESALTYDRKFGVHHFTGLVLYNESKTYYPAINVDIPLGYVGLAGRMTYDYKSKYLLDLNMGYNGSENFAPARRFGLFPAISMGWVMSEEKFMKHVPVIDYLKIRGSYGIVGNDKIGGTRFLYLPDSYLANNGGY